MTSTRLRRINTPADVKDPAVLAAFENMPHYPTRPGRGSYAVDYPAIPKIGREAHTIDYDPLSTEGPNRSTWRLTGYELIGEVPGRTAYVWRVLVNDSREEFVAVQHGPRGLEVCHATDYQPASERTRTAATEKAHAILAEKVADDAAGPCGQCGAPQSSSRHQGHQYNAGHPFVPPAPITPANVDTILAEADDVIAACRETMAHADAVLGATEPAELADDLVAELEADARTACAAGDPAAPALSAVVMRELAGLPVGSRRGRAVMNTWADAYEAQRAREEEAEDGPGGIVEEWENAGHHDPDACNGACGQDRGAAVHEPPSCGCGGDHWTCLGPDGKTCERCAEQYDPEQAGTSEELCVDCTAHNDARVAV